MAEKVVIVGGGGHAWVVLDILQEMAQYDVVGILDSSPNAQGIFDVPVIGSDDQLPALHQQGITGIFIALGSGKVRRKLFLEAVKLGFQPINAIHPSAVISRHAQLGCGVAVMANVVINAGSRIGDNTIINTGTTVDHHAQIGAHVHLAPGCHLAGHVTVGELSFLGTGVSVIPDIMIGHNVVIGAGTAIFRNVPDNSKVVGAPMRYVQIDAAE